MSDFVNFKLAQKLKEKGYPQHWSDNDYIVENEYEDNFEIGAYYDRCLIPEHIVTIAAPTISQVLKWLRKEKKISVEPAIHCSLKWMCGIYGFSDGIEDFTQYSDDGIDDTVYILYDSYEQAALAGIEYVLDNLIRL